MNARKIGIMGGSFNPIHYGHLICGEYAKEKYALEKVIFMPTGLSPFKTKTIDENHRYNMTELAIEDNKDFMISRIEIDREKPTYTIDTIKFLKDKYPDIELFFIAGMDILEELASWKDIDDIFNLCSFIIMKRYNHNIDIDNIPYIDKIHFCDMPTMNISSTDIRNKIFVDEPIGYLLPNKVKTYIEENNLYKNNFYDKYQDKILMLKQNLTEKRFNHSMQVCKMAQKLALRHNEDIEKAFLGGLLHDCCKCFGLDSIYDACNKYNFIMDDTLQKQPELSHSFLGYFVAKDIYKIEDEDILNSIKYHTTGREAMSKLEKIIYISDYIEPTRAYFKGIDKARDLAYQDLDKAMEYILKSTIDFNKKKQRIIHYLSLEAYNYYKE